MTCYYICKLLCWILVVIAYNCLYCNWLCLFTLLSALFLVHPQLSPKWEAKLQGDCSLSRCTHALLPAGFEDRGKGKIEERQATRVISRAQLVRYCWGYGLQYFCIAFFLGWWFHVIIDGVIVNLGIGNQLMTLLYIHVLVL